MLGGQEKSRSDAPSPQTIAPISAPRPSSVASSIRASETESHPSSFQRSKSRLAAMEIDERVSDSVRRGVARSATGTRGGRLTLKIQSVERPVLDVCVLACDRAGDVEGRGRLRGQGRGRERGRRWRRKRWAVHSLERVQAEGKMSANIHDSALGLPFLASETAGAELGVG